MQLKPWKLDAEDTALLDLLPLLEQIFRTNVADVRAVVRSFEGQVRPIALFALSSICSSCEPCITAVLIASALHLPWFNE